MAPNLLAAAGLWLGAAALAPVFWERAAATFTLPKLAVLAAGALISCLGAVLGVRSGSLRVFSTPLDRSLLFGVVVLGAAAACSQDRPLSLGGSYNYYIYGAWPLALCAAVCWLSSWTLAHPERRRQTLGICLAAALAVSIYAVLQAAGVELLPATSHLVGGRAVAMLGSPVSLGAYLAMVFPAALFWLIEIKGARAFGALCAVLIGAGLAASVARASWLSAAAGAFCFFALSGRLKPPAWSRARRAAVLAAALAFAGGLAFLASKRGLTKLSELGRMEIWRASWLGFQERPWIGLGPDTVELAFRRHKTPSYVRSTTVVEYQVHAHNDFLQVLATTGVLGAAAYGFLLWSLIGAARAALTAPGQRSLAAALCSCLVALFINLKFNPAPIEALALAALFAGMLSALGSGPIAAKPAGGALRLGVLLLFCAGSTAAALRLLKADIFYNGAQRAMAGERWELALARYESALRLNGCEMTYHITYINTLLGKAAAITVPAVRGELLERAVASAQRAIACHPNLSNAHYALGAARLVEAQAGLIGSLPESERELDAALEKDPLFVPLLETRLLAAQLRGDPAKTSEIKARISALSALQARR